jgi:hypothetical protein
MMFVSITVLFAIVLAGYAFSRMSVSRSRKSSVQTLFDKKQNLLGVGK